MFSRFEKPTHEKLVAEQESVQREKFQGRLLDEYSAYIFPTQEWRMPKSCAVTDLLRPICIGDKVSLIGVLEGLHIAKQDSPVHWADMGGGRGLAMRQLASMPDSSQKYAMTNVDLFDYGLDDLEKNSIDYLEQLAPGMTDAQVSPRLILDDVESVTLPEPADIITSIEAIQYLNNPLASISNWYNNLADNGILLIATEQDWSHSLGLEDTNCYDETASLHLIQQLEESGVTYAATYEIDWDNGTRPLLDPNAFRILAIQKKPGTEMVVHSDVVDLWTSPHHYKASYYQKPDDSMPSVLDIISR